MTLAPLIASSDRVLVLGGHGFVGSHIARELSSRGVDVRVMDLAPGDGSFSWIEGDIRDEKALVRALDGVDAVISAAGFSEGAPVTDRTVFSVVAAGAKSLVRALEASGISTLIHLSTAAVYGTHEEYRRRRESDPLTPSTREGRAAAEAERTFRAWAAGAEGRRLLTLRCADIVGPGARSHTTRVIRSLAASRAISASVSVKARPLAGVRSVAVGVATLALAEREERILTFNIADTEPLDDHQVRSLIRQVAGLPPLGVSIPGRRLMRVASKAGNAVREAGISLPQPVREALLGARSWPALDTSLFDSEVPERPRFTEELRDTVEWARTSGADAPAVRIAEKLPREGEGDERSVTAIVVTYNREELIGDCLDALAAQTRPVDHVLVIDNASTDSSGRIADEHPSKPIVLHLNRNVGGAGGFCAGMAHAMLHLSPDFLWVMDDDTIPTPTALEELLRAERSVDVHASVLSSHAVWTDGRPHPMNASRTRLGTSEGELRAFEKLGLRPIRTASFVSAFINAKDAWEHGLPHADYFIWSDDFEYTGRLLKHSNGFAVSGSVVEHRTALFSNAQSNPGGRFYYDVRNRIWALAKTQSFTPVEKVLYGGKSALGWARTLVRVRGELLPVGLSGLREGILTSPAPSHRVLAADPERAEDIRVLERSIAEATRSRLSQA